MVRIGGCPSLLWGWRDNGLVLRARFRVWPCRSKLAARLVQGAGLSMLRVMTAVRVGLGGWCWLVLAAVGSAAVGRRHPSDPMFDSGAGSDEQIRWLVGTYGRLVFRVAFAVTHNEALAEEVVQDTMVKAWTSMPSWEGDQPVKWLRTVARNRAISVMRKERRSVAEDDLDRERSNAVDTEQVVEARMLVEAMHEALAMLDEDSRTMIVLRETDELHYVEIAEMFGITPSAVKAKLYRARHELRRYLKDWDL